jgi:hypothetical protein
MKIEKHIEGKRFSKREITTFVSEEGDTPQEASKKRSEYFKKIGRVAGNKIICGESFEVTLNKLMTESESLIQQNISSNVDRDSELDLAKRINLHAKIALNEKNDLFARLNEAYLLGAALQQLITYRIDSNEKSKNSSGERHWLELDEWLVEQFKNNNHPTVPTLWNKLPKDTEPGSEFFFINTYEDLEYGGDHGSRRSMKFSSFQKYMTNFKKRMNT